MNLANLHFLRVPSIGGNKFLAIIIIITAIILLDTSILKSSIFIPGSLVSDLSVFFFVILVVILAIFQCVVLRYVRTRIKQTETRKRQSMELVGLSVFIAQFVLIAILSITIGQIVLGSYYNIGILIAAIIVSYSVSILTLSFLAMRFFSWFRSNKNNIILLYGISAILLSLNALFTLGYSVAILNDKNPVVVPHLGVLLLVNEPGSLKDMLNQVYFFSSIISFVILWIPTAFLLYYYSQRSGRPRFLTILIVPLIYFLSSFINLFVNTELSFGSNSSLPSLILTLLFAYSRPAGGILFGAAFWIVGRGIGSKGVQSYMTMAACGLILFFASNQAVVLVSISFYPPFGIASVAFTGLSSYLILAGLYFSAISISQDRVILSSIRKSALRESDLLRNIGSAEYNEKLENEAMRIATITQSKLVKESGVQSSLGEDEIRQYLDKLIEELKGRKKELP